jgi:3-phosphoshikimate 1-carboxyvinyltransferase
MGAKVEGETPPLRIQGGNLKAIDYASPVASAQVKSCVLLAGLRAKGETRVSESVRSRDHTERMLKALGVPVETSFLAGGSYRAGVKGGAAPRSFEFDVPGDISSAAFLLVAAAMIPASDVTLRNIGVNPTRTGILDVFRQAGIDVRVENQKDELGEPVADLLIRGADSGRPFQIDGELVPRLVDEIPVLAVLATRLDGVSTIRGASELRVKESDRIAKIAEGLTAMGAKVEIREDGLDIEGPTSLRGASIDSSGDHRIAMAFAIAGLVADGETVIDGAESIATSYPGFEGDLKRLQM